MNVLLVGLIQFNLHEYTYTEQLHAKLQKNTAQQKCEC